MNKESTKAALKMNPHHIAVVVTRLVYAFNPEELKFPAR